MKTDKIDDLTLALLQLVLRRDVGSSGTHASTRFDGATLQRLQQKGLLGEIDEQAGVVALTGEGAERSRELFAEFFGEADRADTPHSDVYLEDAFLDEPIAADGALEALELANVEQKALVEQFSSRQSGGAVYLDASTERVLLPQDFDTAPLESDRRLLKVEPLSSDEYWHDMSDFASLVRKGDLAAWIHDVVEASETVEEFREQLDRVEGLLDAWGTFERDRARHRLDRWLAAHGYELAD
ncbi:MAG: UPF0158 family protein [Myxococcota bacterium]